MGLDFQSIGGVLSFHGGCKQFTLTVTDTFAIDSAPLFYAILGGFFFTVCFYYKGPLLSLLLALLMSQKAYIMF